MYGFEYRKLGDIHLGLDAGFKVNFVQSPSSQLALQSQTRFHLFACLRCTGTWGWWVGAVDTARVQVLVWEALVLRGLLMLTPSGLRLLGGRAPRQAAAQAAAKLAAEAEEDGR